MAFVPTSKSTKPEVCVATIFAQSGDKHAGGASPWLRRRVRPTDLGVAHRTHPLGSWVKVTNLRTRKSVRVRVIDRGPYGKLDSQGRWFNGARHPKRRGRFRGCVDLTPATARRIDHNGFEKVRVVVSSNPARYAHLLRHAHHRAPSLVHSVGDRILPRAALRSLRVGDRRRRRRTA
jgi:hypothetical protein